jgi:hypothetical protein
MRLCGKRKFARHSYIGPGTPGSREPIACEQAHIATLMRSVWIASTWTAQQSRVHAFEHGTDAACVAGRVWLVTYLRYSVCVGRIWPRTACHVATLPERDLLASPQASK